VIGSSFTIFPLTNGPTSSLRQSAFFLWSRDNAYIYFDNGYSGGQIISRVNVANGKVQKVLELNDFRRVVTPFSTWFGLTPENDIILMHDTGSQDVYALDLENPCPSW